MRFVLVHGGFHGAWCWAKMIPEREKLGHTALAIDLPGGAARPLRARGAGMIAGGPKTR